MNKEYHSPDDCLKIQTINHFFFSQVGIKQNYVIIVLLIVEKVKIHLNKYSNMKNIYLNP